MQETYKIRFSPLHAQIWTEPVLLLLVILFGAFIKKTITIELGWDYYCHCIVRNYKLEKFIAVQKKIVIRPKLAIFEFGIPILLLHLSRDLGMLFAFFPGTISVDALFRVDRLILWFFSFCFLSLHLYLSCCFITEMKKKIITLACFQIIRNFL